MESRVFAAARNRSQRSLEGAYEHATMRALERTTNIFSSAFR
jgi:hypothetical protein